MQYGQICDSPERGCFEFSSFSLSLVFGSFGFSNFVIMRHTLSGVNSYLSELYASLSLYSPRVNVQILFRLFESHLQSYKM